MSLQQISETDSEIIASRVGAPRVRPNAVLTAVKRFSLAAPLLFAGLQFVPASPRANPSINHDQTLEVNVPMPANVASLIQRACMNCHSHETQWPWYSRIAPLSWAVTKDVNDARRAMNFSRWTVQNGRRPELAIATLAAACGDIQSGRMPKPGYRMLHPESRLTDEEKGQFCTWTKDEIRELAHKKREKPRKDFTKVLQSANDSRAHSSLPLIQK